MNELGTSEEKPLQSWKEIATYLERDVSTVRRWEKLEGLPVRRHRSDRRGSVYAYPSELNAWRKDRRPLNDSVSTDALFQRPRLSLAFSLVIVVSLLSVGNGQHFTKIASASTTTARRVWKAPEANSGGALSSDARYYANSAGPGNNLMVHDMRTGEDRILTENAPGEYSAHPVFGPDDKRIAYLDWREDSTSQLRTVNVDGSDPQLVLADEEVSYIQPFDWMPDGEQILAVAQRKDRSNQIILVSVRDGGVQVLKSLGWRYPNLSLSNDGSFIAYDVPTRRRAPERDIFLLATDGSSEAALVEHPSDDRFPLWTPAGDSVLFQSDRTGTRGYWEVTVIDGQPQGAPRLVKPYAAGEMPIGFSTEGDYYYSVENQMQDVYIVPRDPTTGEIGREPTLASTGLRGRNTYPEWSPDGRHLAYFSREPNFESGAWSGAIVLREVETGEERRMPLGVRMLIDSRLRWSPDGASLLLGGQDKDHQGLYRMNVETGEITLVIAGSRSERWQTAWAADGEAVYYVRDQADEQCEIRIRDLENGSERVVYRPATGTHVSNPSLSPNGEWLAFGEGQLAHNLSERVRVMPAGGGEPREIHKLDQTTHQRYLYSLEWEPDGGHILVAVRVASAATQVPSTVWRLSVAGGDPENLHLAVWGRGGLRISPDRKRLAFVHMGGTSELWAVENFQGIGMK